MPLSAVLCDTGATPILARIAEAFRSLITAPLAIMACELARFWTR
jgi:hypothetical protein